MQSQIPWNTNQQPKQRKPIRSLIFGLIVLAAGWFVLNNTQLINDTYSFWSYKPSQEMAAIAARSQLTDNGKFLFYASKPVIDGSAAFNQECGRKEAGTAILGCYTNNKIYIYDVNDNRLDGIEEVTASHEMLHAVYQRLSDSEKDQINQLVEVEFEKLKSDPNYTERMAFYDRTEPGQRDNELHSIIGTEVADISDELENHYAKYFSDRKTVTNLFASYNGTFTSLEKQADSLGQQLENLNEEIQSLTAVYNSSLQKLNADIALFNERAANGVFTSQSQFNSERSALVSRTSALSSQRAAINNRVDQYNTIKDQYNDIVTQSNNLYKSIDSTLAPAPAI